jgi:hypothetical protein
MLNENEEVKAGLQKQLGHSKKFIMDSQLLVSYFCSFVAKSIK